jgi:hypothetical protein
VRAPPSVSVSDIVVDPKRCPNPDKPVIWPRLPPAPSQRKCRPPQYRKERAGVSLPVNAQATLRQACCGKELWGSETVSLVMIADSNVTVVWLALGSVGSSAPIGRYYRRNPKGLSPSGFNSRRGNNRPSAGTTRIMTRSPDGLSFSGEAGPAQTYIKRLFEECPVLRTGDPRHITAPPCE